MKTRQVTHARVNITMPKERLSLIDRIRGDTNRSRFIDDAVSHYVRSRSRARLRNLLQEDGLVNRDRDLALVEEWAAVDEETWQRVRK